MKDIFPPNNRRSIRNITPPREEGGESPKIKDNFSGSLGAKKIRDFKVKIDNGTKENGTGGRGYEEENIDQGSFNNDRKTPVIKRENGSKWKWWLFGSVFVTVAILIVGFGVSSQFATAEVTLEPITFETDVEEVLTAYKTPSQGQLGFDVITINHQDPKEIVLEAPEMREVESRASGMITIYNEHSQEEQVLVESTRFESPDGLIFRISSGVTVPGMSGGEPGRVQVEVIADEPGEQYNIGPTRFTIPGFQGSARFDGFYADSNSEMSGGEVGMRPVLDGIDMDSIRDEFKHGLEDDLVTSARNSVPDGFLLFDGLYLIDEELDTEAEGSDVIVTMTASLVGVILDEQDLSQYIYRALSDQGEEPVEVDDWGTVEFQLQSEVVTQESDPVEFSVSGALLFYQKVDKGSLASDLAGIPLKDKEFMNSVLERYPASRVEAEVSPFWIRKLPSNPENININIRY